MGPVRYSRHDKINAPLHISGYVCFIALVHIVAALWAARMEMMCRVHVGMKEKVKRVLFFRI